jgi:sec-independent protein translocase protein TatA
VSSLTAVADEGERTVHFGSAAEIFGVDGIIVLVVVVLVLFGSTQIPKLARSLGSAQKEFKKGLDEGAAEDGRIGRGKASGGAGKAPSMEAASGSPVSGDSDEVGPTEAVA